MNWPGYHVVAVEPNAFLIGTYTRETESSGIYYVESDGTCQCVIETDNPSYLVKHPTEPFVYCVNEISDYQDADHPNSVSGAVSAYKTIVQQDGSFYFEPLNQQSSMGADPCHLEIDPDAQFLVVSNYSGGTFATLPMAGEGLLDSFQSLTQHVGSGPNLERQASAHVHSSLFLKNSRTLLVADLGADRVSQYVASEHGDIELARQHIVCEPGSGPRFLAASDKALFVLNELDNSLSRYDLAQGRLTQKIAIIPDTSTANLAAHLVLSADQQYLYLSNRGFDTLSVYAVEPELRLLQTIPSGGEHPRHFALFNNEQGLAVANLFSNNLVLFDREPESGLLKQTDIVIDVPSPACVLPWSIG